MNKSKCAITLFPLLFVLLLSGCATENYYAKTIHSWKGSSTKHLFNRWGYPNKIAALPNKHRLLMYKKLVRATYPAYLTPGFTGGATQRGTTVMTPVSRELNGGNNHGFHCSIWFETNRNNRIVNTSFHGNHCIASKEFYDAYGRHV